MDKVKKARHPVQKKIDQGKLNAHPPTRRDLESIHDPLERFDRAALISRQSSYKSVSMQDLRRQRETVAFALYRWHGWFVEAIVEFLQAKDRRYIDKALDLLDERNIPPEYRDIEVAKARALELQKEFEERKLIGITAREFRRMMIVGLTTGQFYDGQAILNKHLARRAGLSNASIAHGRTGSSGRKRAEDRAEEAKNRTKARGKKVA